MTTGPNSIPRPQTVGSDKEEHQVTQQVKMNRTCFTPQVLLGAPLCTNIIYYLFMFTSFHCQKRGDAATC